jgi:hypothetical protein
MNFVMTYPCYIPLRLDQVPLSCSSGGDTAILIFSDGDLLERHLSTIFPGQSGFVRLNVPDAESLSEVLEEWRGRTLVPGKPPASWVGVDIDARSGRAPWMCSIEDFIQMLHSR